MLLKASVELKHNRQFMSRSFSASVSRLKFCLANKGDAMLV